MKLKGYLKKMERPTQEMEEYYIKRTTTHIMRVQRYCNILTNKNKDLSILRHRGIIHDSSKFQSDEYYPYIWLTWYYKCKNEKIDFEYPSKSVELSTQMAWKSHESMNPHHPGYHNDVSLMSLIDLAEMVCDLAAMSEEFGGDPYEYFKKNIQTKFTFSKKQISIIKGLFILL